MNESLVCAISRRTSIEAGTPMGVDLEIDELAFFPLLYWPVTEQQPGLSELARRKVNDYISNGGTILFDLRPGMDLYSTEYAPPPRAIAEQPAPESTGPADPSDPETTA